MAGLFNPVGDSRSPGLRTPGFFAPKPGPHHLRQSVRIEEEEIAGDDGVGEHVNVHREGDADMKESPYQDGRRACLPNPEEDRHKKLNHYTEESKDHQVFGFGHETLQLCEPFLGEKSTHSEPHILGRQLSAYVGGEDLTTQEGGTEFMKRSIEVHDAELELDQALEGEGTNATQKRVQSWPALSQHPEECFDREGVIGWREEKEKQDQEEKIRVISEIHLVGKENVSLKEDQHATRKPHPDPNTQEEDQREL